MSETAQDSQPSAQTSDKELNFRRLEQKYQAQLDQERAARIAAERVAQEASQRQVQPDDDDDDEPYVNKKRLNNQLARYGEKAQKQTQSDIQKAVHTALQEERKSNWMKQNPDFYDIMEHAEKLAQTDPELAETILEMPNGFERQKLVYKNIKALGLHKPKEVAPPIQDKVDANRRSPYYQPSGVGSAPYSSNADFSQMGQKQAYEKMQELIGRRRG